MHIYSSIVQYTPERHSFSQVFPFHYFPYSSFIRSILNLFSFTQNAFLLKTIGNILPHSCSRCRPGSTSCERLVRSVYSRQMLLGCTCRVWYLGIGPNCQSLLYLYKAPRFSMPFTDAVCLRIHSGALLVEFRTLPLPPVGKL